MRHRNPSGDLAEVIDRALDALLLTLEKQKFGATIRPRAVKAPRRDADPSHVPNAVKREVHARDAEQCAFVSADGVRCTERGFLEYDRRTPQCLGGKPTAAGTRLLCQAHNQYEAERLLGADFMRDKRAEAAAKKAQAAPLESDVVLALRGMGFTAAETRRAMEETRHTTATTFEQRIRAVLAELMRSRSFRCSDGPFDAFIPIWYAS